MDVLMDISADHSVFGQRFGNDFSQGHDTHAELKVKIDLGKLVYTVMAGGGNDLCAGLPDLLGLDSGDLHPTFVVLAHGQLPASATTAVVVGPARVHLDKITYAVFQDEALLLNDSATPDQVAGIMQGNTLHYAVG